MADCIFCKIAAGEIPSEKVYEDEEMIIIKDINPQTKIHLLAIPKKHFESVSDMTESDAQIVGRCLYKIGKLADKLGLENGYRIVSNKGDDGCQSVKHLHIHVLGGQKLAEKMC